ncbi:hypothetical protein NA57DRAFT_60104 [Rhizodiscina lignyota]|uniref:Uncharacterized protein n=1 Tax=Rhizodiscina lignyota TaxID=1504668 RepID=A0A9P4I953_9PEZI|nr:hypothetical protein NA57DRAFT_60104 [Rhizodiscina lignyota]
MAQQPVLSELCSVCLQTLLRSAIELLPSTAVRGAPHARVRYRAISYINSEQYAMRSRLETPAGIDHDYNFLTGVERGLGEAAVTTNIKTHVQVHGRDFRKRLEENRVTHKSMPAGMSRQRMNKTQWDGKLEASANSEQDAVTASREQSKIEDSRDDNPVIPEPGEGILEDTPRYFYFLKPRTPSHQPKVLVPLDASQPFINALHDQAILEFPTIVVLSRSIDNLPAEYISEDEFYRRMRADLEPDMLDQDPRLTDPVAKTEDGEINEDDNIDEAKILEAMEKDFGSST